MEKRTLTLHGLQLVALNVCKEGKRLFLQEAGINTSRLGDSELDLPICFVRLDLPETGETWIRAVKTGFLPWLISRNLWFPGQALAGQAGEPPVRDALVAAVASNEG